MTDVLAALDESPTAPLVLRTARRLAAELSGTCRAVHVRPAGSAGPLRLVDPGETELAVLSGDPATEIGRHAEDASVGLIVVGARSDPEGPVPAGHVAISVVEQARKPVVVITPGAAAGELLRLDRVLIPLEGTSQTTEQVGGILPHLVAAGATLVALHVFDVGTVPQFWDDPAHSGHGYASGFGSKWWPGSEPVEVLLRRGDPASTVIDVAEREGVDLIVLGWAQDLSPGHAAVVRAALARGTVPVLLVPLSAGGEVRSDAPSPIE